MSSSGIRMLLRCLNYLLRLMQWVMLPDKLRGQCFPSKRRNLPLFWPHGVSYVELTRWRAKQTTSRTVILKQKETTHIYRAYRLRPIILYLLHPSCCMLYTQSDFILTMHMHETRGRAHTSTHALTHRPIYSLYIYAYNYMHILVSQEV